MKILRFISKGLFVLSGLIMCFVSSYSQSSPSFVAIRSGLSIPVGKYYAKTLDGGSFALPGLNVTAEGAWFFHPNFGIGAAVGMNFNPVDVGNLGYEKVQADPFLEDTYIRSEPYNVGTAMGGMYVQYPLSPDWSLTAKALAGLLYVKTPYQVAEPEYFQVGPQYEVITSAKDYKFSWQAGFGVRYEITPCYALVFDTDFMYDKASFTFSTNGGTSTRTDEKIISLINTTVGVRFNLKNNNKTASQ